MSRLTCPLDLAAGSVSPTSSNTTHETVRWVDHHPLQAFAIILTVISLFYLLVGGFVGRV